LEEVVLPIQTLFDAARRTIHKPASNALLRLCADYVIEQGHALSATSLSTKKWATEESDHIRMLLRIAKLLHDPGLEAIAERELGDSEYTTGDDAAALYHFKQAGDSLRHPEHQLMVWLTEAKIMAHANRRDDFNMAEAQILTILASDYPSLGPDIRVSALEAIARGYGQFDAVSVAESNLVQAKELCRDFEASGHHVPVAKLQLMKCEIGLLQNSENEMNRIVALATAGKLLAEQTGVYRYEDYFGKLSSDGDRNTSFAK
jgi:hypothetical protein